MIPNVKDANGRAATTVPAVSKNLERGIFSSTALLPFVIFLSSVLFLFSQIRPLLKSSINKKGRKKSFDTNVIKNATSIIARRVRRMFMKILRKTPDFIFFTGDLVNNVASEMKDYQNIFSKIKAPLGVFSVLGNHDYGDYHFGREPSAAKARNLANVKATHKNMGWDLLLNENRRLKIGGDEIAIIGIENWGEGRFAKYGRMDVAVKGTEDAPVKLLMSHDPSHWRAQVIPEYNQIDAMFSGHTHGMQFGIITKGFQWSPVQYIYKEWAGLYQEQQQKLYVNVGYGFLGYPGRVGILPEITIFELRSGNS